MTTTIRSAKVSDAAAIAQVHVDTWRTAYPGIVPQDYLDALDPVARKAQWKEWLVRDDVYIFVAECTGTICGFISGGVLRDGVDVASKNYDSEIYTLYVTAAAQGHGAGRELMSALAERLVEMSLMRPVVWALAKNPWCGFYERLGGTRVAEKTIEIGGAALSDVAFGWEDIGILLRRQPRGTAARTAHRAL